MKKRFRAYILLVILTLALILASAPADGQTFLYVNDNPGGPNTVTAFSVSSNGTLTPVPGSPFFTGGTGTGCLAPTSCLYGPNSIAILNQGFLFVANLGSNDISVFVINPATGVLGLVPGSPFATGNSGPSEGISLAVAASEPIGGPFLVVGNGLLNTASIFSQNTLNGALTNLGSFSLGNTPLGIKVSPDGALVAAAFATSGVGMFNSLLFGTLVPVSGSPFVTGDADQEIDITCAGNRLFASGLSTGGTTSVDVFALSASGNLKPISGSPFQPGVGTSSTATLLSPGGKFLFVGDGIGGDVLAFSVASDGALSLVAGSPFSVGGSLNPDGLAIDPTGSFLFTSNLTGSVSAFSVGTNGALTLIGGTPLAVPGAPNSIAVYPPITCNHPAPMIAQPLVPDATAPGGLGFTLTVNGSDFVTTSSVSWNGSILPTSFVNRNQLIAPVPASAIASNGTEVVTVLNNGPGGGASNPVPFTITGPTSSITLSSTAFQSQGFNPQTIVSADFNRDGKQDLAVLNVCGTNSACTSGGTVAIFLGNGDGTFTSKSTIAVSANANAMAVNYLNNDGFPDLVIGYFDGVNYTIATFLGNGDGTFSVGPVVETGGSATGTVVTGDFDGDGIIDVAVPTTGRPDFGNRTCVFYLNNGQLPNLPCTSGVPNGAGGVTSAVTGDFNGDGVLDLAVTVSGTTDALTVLLGNGDGTFTAASTQPTLSAAQPNSLAVGDFNGDGKLDLALVTMGSTQLSIYLGNGDGTFTQTGNASSVGDSPFAVATGDFNGDGILDLAVTNQCGSIPGCTLGSVSGSISILLGDGRGNFNAATTASIGNQPEGVVLADFNGDGRIDLAVTDYAAISFSVLLQSPAVALAPTTLTFGNQDSATTSAPQQVILTNIGSATLIITGLGISSPSDFAVAGGSCPTLPQLAPGANCTINVTFTPTQAGARSGTLTTLDNAPGTQTITLSGTGLPQLLITSSSTLPAGTAGRPYSEALQATGGLSPYTFALSSGALPTNLTLNGGVISGTPIEIGPFNFTITVTDANNGTASLPFSLAINPGVPTCTVSLQGSSNPQTITAATDCVDPQGESLTTTIDWGDGSQQTTGTGGSLTASHTYASTQQLQTYLIAVTSIDTSALQGGASTSFVAAGVVPPLVPGQSATLNPSISGGLSLGNVQVTVTFECASVTKSDGSVVKGAQNITSALGITCSTNPPTQTLTGASKPVSIVISTTGSGHASLVPKELRKTWCYTVWLPLPAIIFLGGVSSRRRRSSGCFVVIMLVWFLSTLTSCGGGFNVPQVTETKTPAGAYQVTIVDHLQPPTQTNGSGFVQTSLIVPLTVNPAP